MRRINVKTMLSLWGVILTVCAQSLYSQEIKTELPVKTFSSESLIQLDSTIIYTPEGVPESKTEYSYLLQENGRNETSFYWDESLNSWIPGNKEIYKYDQYGYLTWQENQSWNREDNAWLPSSRNILAHNEQGLPTLNSFYTWDQEAGVWIGNSMQVTEYDNQNRITLQGSYTWDYDNNVWIGLQKSITGYDQNDNMNLHEVYNWNQSLNDWYLENKFMIVYDEKREIVSSIYYSWNPDTNTLEITSKEETTQNESGQIDSRTFYQITENGLQPSSRILYHYDQEGNLSGTESFLYDEAITDWYASLKSSFTKDDNGNSIETISMWERLNSEWLLSQKIVREYNENEKLLREEKSKWNTNLSAWVNTTRIIRNYDIVGNEILTENQMWKNNQWVGTSKSIKAFNINNQQILFENYTRWDEVNNIWIGSSKSIYEYNDARQPILVEFYTWDVSNRWRGTSRQSTLYTNGEQNGSISYQWDNVAWNWVNSTRTETLFDPDGLRTSFGYYIWDKGTAQWKTNILIEYINKDGFVQKETYYRPGSSSDLEVYQYILYYYSTTALSVSKDAIHFEAAGGEEILLITSNRNWSVSSDSEWLSIEPTTGEGDSQLSIRASANLGNAGRSGIITVSTPGITVSIRITQEGNSAPPIPDYHLYLSDHTLNIPASGSTETVSIYSNTNWQINSDADWITVTPLAGSNDWAIQIMASPNSGKGRTASLTVSGEHVENAYLSIHQYDGTPTGNEDIESPGIHISPNPVKDHFLVAGADGPLHVSIYDLSGSIRLSQKTQSDQPVYMTGFEKGFYLVKVVTPRETVVRKIVKQ